MKTTHEEADNIIVQQMVAAANENQKGISVLSDDTDVFCAFASSLPCTKSQPAYYHGISCKRQKTCRHSRDCYKEIIPDLIAAHAISGCDTVACCYGIGKGKVLKTLKLGQTLSKLGDPEDMSDVVPEATAFMSACYGHPKSHSMSVTRQKLWAS